MRIRILFVSILLLTLSVIAPSFGEETLAWKEYKCQHFVIYYNEAPYDFVENVEHAAEQEYEEIARNLGFTRYEGWSWDRRAKIYIYDDQETYVGAHNISWSDGVALIQERTIRTFPAAAGFFDSTLPHELGHIIFREFVGFKAEIPLWMDEGVAMYQEKAKRWGANKIVAQAIQDGKFIPLKELTEMSVASITDKELVNLFYAEAASVVYYMITELGEYRFVRFCRELKQGIEFNEALRRVYPRFDDLDDLNKSWIRYLAP